MRRIDATVGVGALIARLSTDGYRVVGPVVRDGTVTYDDVADEADLPRGVSVEQSPGRWRLTQGDEPTRFAWTPGAESWKRFVFPPRSEVVRVRRTDGSFAVTAPPPPDRPLALIGARDCELRALDVLDHVFLDAEHPDPRYAARRAGTVVVAVTCTAPSATCWCTSTGGDPVPHSGWDVRLTELTDPHRLLAEAATPVGAALLDALPGEDASVADLTDRDGAIAAARSRIHARVNTARLPAALAGAELHPHWEEVAARCLSCGSCTSVCPTCFCSSFADTTALDAPGESVREQTWVSCFQMDHSQLGGRPARATTAMRYRQWLTHKLQTWPAQFDTVGCVGCGRCTTWCPAGIDIAAEALVLSGGTP